MKIKFFLFIISLFSVFYSYGQRFVILHTNDIHSNLTGFGPECKYTPLAVQNDFTLGGFSRLATIISHEKIKNPDKVIVCDAGDFLMGTIFHVAEVETGFQLWLMKQIGYDIVTLGNHEFEFGPDYLAKVINASVKNGDIPDIVSSQMIFSDKETGDDNLQKLVEDSTISQYQIYNINGLKIGIFGLLSEEAIHTAPAIFPLTFENYIKNAKKISEILRNNEKCDIIIALSHSGFYYDADGIYFGEDIDLATKVPDIDVIISGHTHVASKTCIKQGKTLIVQTGEYLNNLGRLELNFENGVVNLVEFSLIPIDDKILGDTEVQKLIDEFKEELNTKYFASDGYKYDEIFARTTFPFTKSIYGETSGANMGFFIADAIKYYTDTYAKKTDVVIVAEGVIREDFLVGKISFADIFRVVPLGNGINDYKGYSLANVYVTANELKKLFELMIFNNKPGEDSYLYFSGADVYFNPENGFLNKVEKIVIDGNEIDISKKNKELYCITTNTYILNFITDIKKMSKGLIKVVPKSENGEKMTSIQNQVIDYNKTKSGIQEGKEWKAIIEYLKSMETEEEKIPFIPEKYKNLNTRFIEIE